MSYYLKFIRQHSEDSRSIFLGHFASVSRADVTVKGKVNKKHQTWGGYSVEFILKDGSPSGYHLPVFGEAVCNAFESVPIGTICECICSINKKGDVYVKKFIPPQRSAQSMVSHNPAHSQSDSRGQTSSGRDNQPSSSQNDSSYPWSGRWGGRTNSLSGDDRGHCSSWYKDDSSWSGGGGGGGGDATPPESRLNAHNQRDGTILTSSTQKTCENGRIVTVATIQFSNGETPCVCEYEKGRVPKYIVGQWVVVWDSPRSEFPLFTFVNALEDKLSPVGQLPYKKGGYPALPATAWCGELLVIVYVNQTDTRVYKVDRRDESDIIAVQGWIGTGFFVQCQVDRRKPDFHFDEYNSLTIWSLDESGRWAMVDDRDATTGAAEKSEGAAAKSEGAAEKSDGAAATTGGAAKTDGAAAKSGGVSGELSKYSIPELFTTPLAVFLNELNKDQKGESLFDIQSMGKQKNPLMKSVGDLISKNTSIWTPLETVLAGLPVNLIRAEIVKSKGVAKVHRNMGLVEKIVKHAVSARQDGLKSIPGDEVTSVRRLFTYGFNHKQAGMIADLFWKPNALGLSILDELYGFPYNDGMPETIECINEMIVAHLGIFFPEKTPGELKQMKTVLVAKKSPPSNKTEQPVEDWFDEVDTESAKLTHTKQMIQDRSNDVWMSCVTLFDAWKKGQSSQRL